MAASQAGVDCGGLGHALESQLVELARARGPLRRVAAALAARLVEREGWSRLGFARLGDYARERLGVSLRSVQEWARMGGRLLELPQLDAALVDGRLSWSKALLLARFATPEDEQGWIERAAGVSVRTLEEQLRAADRGSLEAGALERVDPDGEPTRWVRIPLSGRVAHKFIRTRAYASKVEGRTLSSAEALERITAEVLSALPVELEVRDTHDPDPGVVGDPTPRCTDAAWHDAYDLSPFPPLPAPPDAPVELPAFLRPLLADLEDADAFELDARLRRVVRLEQRLDAQLAPLLSDLTSSQYEWRQRYASLATLARECLGISPSKARALLRVERVGAVCPALRDAFRDGSLSWVQADALAPLLDRDAEGEWRDVWVRFAPTVTVRQLRETVERARFSREADPEEYAAHRDDPAYFCEPAPERSDAERQTCARPTDSGRDIRMRFRAPVDVARLFDAVLCTLRRAIGRETGHLPPEDVAFEVMIDHALASWNVDDADLRRRMSKRHYAVLDRDDWRCVFPGCTSRRNLHVHHIRFRSAGGGDEPSNLTTLCVFHHQRGVHDGQVEVRGQAPGGLEFALGLRRGQAPLARYCSGDRVA